MDDTSPYVFIAALLISGVIGAAVAQAKKASMRQGFAWGLILGPIGWIIAAIVLQPLAAPPDKAAVIAEKMAKARALAQGGGNARQP